MDMVINLNSVQANDVFVIYISSKLSLHNHAYLIIFMKLKSKLVFCQQQQHYSLLYFTAIYRYVTNTHILKKYKCIFEPEG